MIADLKDKVVVVTGASTGIGAAAAKGFAANGSKVVVHYNANAEAAEQVAAEIRSGGGEVVTVQGDVTETDAPRHILGTAMTAFGRIDVLVNNAGSMLGRRWLQDVDDAHFDRVMRLNAWSVFAFTREVHPIMKEQGGGNIINVSSIAARVGGGGGSVIYAASKGFVSTFTRGMARELWADRIRVNAVSPGFIATPFHERYSTAQQHEAARASIPMGRAGVADDCTGAFLYLASDELSGYVIGQVIEVNGGQLMP